MSLSRKVKTALDENRLLILGAQVLFGFQFQGVFQEAFTELSSLTRALDCAALVLMALTLGLLVAPSMQHRIVEDGADTNRIRTAGTFATAALLPFAVSLGLYVFIVFEHLFGSGAAAIAGVGFCMVAVLFWFIIGLVLRRTLKVRAMSQKEEPTPLSTRIEQMLTEARVIVPGAQALLGFQLAVTFTRAFAELDATLRIVHVVALCSVSLAVVVLMTPAALHRIAFRGQDTKSFLSLGSAFVLAAPVPLALGLALDMQVAIAKTIEAPGWATGIAAVSFAVLFALWYAVPMMMRRARS